MSSVVRSSASRLLSRGVVVSLVSLAALAAAACAAKGDGGGFFPSGDADGGAATGDGGVATPDDSGTGGGFGDVVAPDPGTGNTVFYAHSGKTLYSVDAKDPKLGITEVGNFDCIGAGLDSSMTDIAVDRSGKIYGISRTSVYAEMKITSAGVECAGNGKTLQPATAKSVFYGASFAPVGTVDANAEVLVVGNTDGELYKVDTSDGSIQILGTFGNVPPTDGVAGHKYPQATQGKPWQLSGDIVFLKNGSSPVGFATVRDCETTTSQSKCNEVDTLLEIDLSKLKVGNTGSVTKAVRGQVVKASGCQDSFAASYGHMYGIAAYQGDIIGFSQTGFVVKIDNVRGGACRIADDAAIVSTFAGAGVTTVAPVIAPPQ